ncbi:hypothetical protein IEZ26_15850 [Nocardioides cavernae]|uniref:DUF222 domain-containing protein n=1 Tax=Nocardioides cavernae TaxID=1921566 RepID=A0ABR8ND86_9ACTN|nr:hypothetical protein [Nocardioides cavernae]MBD3926098.1 hypothetical protein [Nocardioides cavernae]MBM7513687.1 hypothetical protein [Nocardioides cavernae]
MLDLEQQVLALLTGARGRRFTWLAQQRLVLAETVAQTDCFGVTEAPSLDQQVELVEETLLNMVPDLDLAAELAAEYAIRDAALIHGRGEPPAGFDCSVCSGRFGIHELLARIPAFE